jgi:hypothetical protein
MSIALKKPSRRTAAEKLSGRRRPVGYRQPVKRTNASNSPDLWLAKGKTKHEEDAEYHAREVTHKRDTRAKVWKRSSTCESCDDTEQQTAQKWPKAEHEMHENESRAKTRGRAPEERFSTANCARTCGICHSQITANRRRFLPLTPAGMDGSYFVQRAASANPREKDWVNERYVERTPVEGA